MVLLLIKLIVHYREASIIQRTTPRALDIPDEISVAGEKCIVVSKRQLIWTERSREAYLGRRPLSLYMKKGAI